MKKIIEMSNSDRKFIFNYASIKLNLHPAIIEKDFWICFILDYLFNESKYKSSFTFKGGTSLSKSYNVISRMSEDIDIILNWEILGISKNEPFEIRSKRQQELYNKKINELTIRFIENELLEDIKNGLKHVGGLKVEPVSNDQVINIYYPQVNKAENIGILPCIRLEIGALAAWSPASISTITPYINNIIDNFVVSSTNVRTVSISRSFYEKITILHREANRKENKMMPKRYARHYYDVYKIYKSPYISDILNDKRLLKKVTEFKMKFYNDNWANYYDVLINKISLVPKQYRFKEIERDYQSMSEMLIGDIPSINDIFNSLRELEEILNKVEK